MAAPTYFNSASNPADNGTGADNSTLAVTPPASMTSGDLVVLIGVIQDTTGVITVSEAGGQTWSSANDITGANDMDVVVYWCQYNGTWSADPSLAFGSETGTQPATAIMHVFRPDTAGTWRVDTAIAGGAEASASPTVISGITTNKRDTVTLACWAIPNASTWSSLSGTGWAVTGTAQYRNTSGSDQSAAFAHYLAGAAGATGDVSYTPSTAAAGVSLTMAWYNHLAPTIALNTADATDFGADTTPTVEFTGTDGNSDDVRYNVQVSTSNTFEAIADSYTEANFSTYGTLDNSTQGVGQSFTGDGGTLDSVTFYLGNGGLTSGDATVKVYAHSGTFGTSGVPSGAALATAETIPVTSLKPTVVPSPTLELARFYFFGANRITLTNGTNYVATLEFADGTATEFLVFGVDNSSPTHGGNYTTLVGGSWSAVSSIDGIFYVYTMATEPLLYEVSGTDSGFANTVTGGDTDPFNSGEMASFTVQGGDALSDGTYYWRARAKDPNGGGAYSSWATARSFTILTAPPGASVEGGPLIRGGRLTKGKLIRGGRLVNSGGAC